MTGRYRASGVEGAVSLWELLNLGAAEHTAWMREGLCAQTDPEAFFPDKGESPRPARAVCASCPVLARCRDYAVEHYERFGIWGGTSPREREDIRRERRAAAAADLVWAGAA